MSPRSTVRAADRAVTAKLLIAGVLLLGSVITALWSSAHAAEPPPYDDAVLAEWQQRYPRGIISNLREVILPRLEPAERRALEKVGIRFPLRIPGREPFAFAADTRNQTLFMSIQSLKFLDDANIAIAWLERNGYSSESVYNYLTMLRNWQAAEPPPPLLTTLCIPADALQDPDVDSLAQKSFSTAVVFILLHELGHIYLNHSGYEGVQPSTARANERAADAFALNALARIGDVPLGVVNLFLTMAYLHESRTDFSSGSNHALQLAARTHPLSSQRLNAFADALDASAGGYAGSGLTRLEIITTTAQIRMIARNFLDIQRLTALIGQTIRPQDLGPIRHGGKLGRNCRDAAPTTGTFSGLFSGTVTVNGVKFDLEVEMARSGSTVRGRSSYGLGVSDFEGIIEGDTLHYDWQLGNVVGRGILKRQAGGYAGSWGNGNSATNGGLTRLGTN